VTKWKEIINLSKVREVIVLRVGGYFGGRVYNMETIRLWCVTTNTCNLLMLISNYFVEINFNDYLEFT